MTTTNSSKVSTTSENTEKTHNEDFQGHNIGYAGAGDLAAALSRNTLKTLVLDGYAGAEDLAAALSRNTIETLVLDVYWDMDAQSVEAYAEAAEYAEALGQNDDTLLAGDNENLEDAE